MVVNTFRRVARKQLLQEAARRETMPRLAEAIADAQRVVAAGAGEPVDMSRWG